MSASQLIDFARAVSDAGLLASTCGNVSLRLDAERIVISASGAALATLEPREISTVSIAEARPLAGPKPSMETSLHCRAYRARARCGAVLHCQSRAATLLACMREPPRSLDFIPEIPAYVRAHAYVPYGDPGSDALAAAVEAALADDDDVTVVQMVNHGQIVVGDGWPAVVRRATFFELACWMASQGRELTTIPPESVARLRAYGRRDS